MQSAPSTPRVRIYLQDTFLLQERAPSDQGEAGSGPQGWRKSLIPCVTLPYFPLPSSCSQDWTPANDQTI